MEGRKSVARFLSRKSIIEIKFINKKAEQSVVEQRVIKNDLLTSQLVRKTAVDVGEVLAMIQEERRKTSPVKAQIETFFKRSASLPNIRPQLMQVKGRLSLRNPVVSNS